MTAEQFAYWFQGFAELSSAPPTQEQWDSMRAHVATVFVKNTPQIPIRIMHEPPFERALGPAFPQPGTRFTC